ncbi:hypothetical protein KQX54_004202 [Cotesia glomerata]|uniref:Uncharacterized protein n=1 Tax=Cotesia glomerata TaxID=32391 RepID=A0AAV7J747_COTGL|nr:hypothetical protein KQX54_004202 [Cotesia glomerata]
MPARGGKTSRRPSKLLLRMRYKTKNFNIAFHHRLVMRHLIPLFTSILFFSSRRQIFYPSTLFSKELEFCAIFANQETLKCIRDERPKSDAFQGSKKSYAAQRDKENLKTYIINIQDTRLGISHPPSKIAVWLANKTLASSYPSFRLVFCKDSGDALQPSDLSGLVVVFCIPRPTAPSFIWRLVQSQSACSLL